MKKHIIFILLSVIAVCSCSDNDLRDTTPLVQRTDIIEDSWARVDAEGYSDTVYSFISGKLYKYAAKNKYYYKDAVLWDCPADAFELFEYGSFRIIKGILYFGAENQKMGEISVEYDVLTIGDVDFRRLSYLTLPGPHQDQTCIDAVMMDNDYIYMDVGDFEKINAFVLPETAIDRRLVWRSTNPSVVDVDQDGLIVAKAVCDTAVNIIASSFFNEEADTCLVTVRNILSKKGTSNCYVVRGGGYYCFDASVKGNSFEKTGIGATADVLWEVAVADSGTSSGVRLIKECYFDIYTGMLSFSVAPGISGNALLALFDASDTILWSWHIWVSTGFDPLENAQVYYGDAGTVVDRNLGALSADSKKKNLTHGLYYQWGKRTPLVPKSGMTYFSKEFQGIEEAGDQTWWSTGQKTQSDPCPPGWRVPGCDLWTKAMERRTGSYSERDGGISFKGYYSDADVWYPLAGCMKDGNIQDAGMGRYWAAVEPDKKSGTDRFQLSISRNDCKIEVCSSACGCSIRCIKE